MTFEEWFERELEGLPHIAKEILRKLRPEFERVWNSAVESCAQEIEGNILPNAIRKKKIHKNNNK